MTAHTQMNTSHGTSSPGKLQDREFKMFSSFIQERTGIQLPPAKKTMLESRLQKRLKVLGIGSFPEYARYAFSPDANHAELTHMIDVVTTNKTDFFREPNHFEYLTTAVLPEISRRRGNNPAHPIRIWSAGCSTGEEPYTLAMVLADYTERNHGFRYSILASDICTNVLETARTAIYQEDRASGIAAETKKKYLLRSKDRKRHLIRICPQLRSQIEFRRINFMDPDFGLDTRFDIIFCRNVVIYFDKPTQEALINKFHHELNPGGFLFLGHSESLNGIDVKFNSVASTVYKKI